MISLSIWYLLFLILWYCTIKSDNKRCGKESAWQQERKARKLTRAIVATDCPEKINEIQNFLIRVCHLSEDEIDFAGSTSELYDLFIDSTAFSYDELRLIVIDTQLPKSCEGDFVENVATQIEHTEWYDSGKMKAIILFSSKNLVSYPYDQYQSITSLCRRALGDPVLASFGK